SPDAVVVESAPVQPAMISPVIDNLMIGGASLIAFVFFWLFVDKSTSTTAIAWIGFYLSFVVNWPHFMASYQLLYSDYKHLILKKRSFFWAAVVSPILIIAVITAGVLSKNVEVFSLMIQGMYLTVGWHYVKQIYGIAIVSSAVQKRYFDKYEKVFILLNLYSVWAMSWVHANVGLEKRDVDGVSYYGLGLPAEALTIAYAMTALTLVLAIGVMVRKYIRTGQKPTLPSLIAFAAIYCWYIPTIYHPVFFYMIPFFHSLQYMLFIVTLKKNKAKSESLEFGDGPTQRLSFLKSFAGFFAIAGVTGWLSFEYIPKTLDVSMPFDAMVFGPTLWFFAFNIFINLHHYFIDNVIWRGDNEILRTHLVQASQNGGVR
ncbi:MAG: hypothetical protein V4692_03045, partial [Bdellovibrionota bacterium]